MSYKVEYERLDETVALLSEAVDSWLKENNQLDSSVKAIIGSNNISGNAADSLKSYLSYSYPLINRSFSDLVKLFIDNLIIYRQDYYGSIDPDSATVIHDRELFTIKDQIRMWDSEASNVGAEAQSVAASVSDLVAFPSLDTNMVNAAAKIITQKIENLDADINSLENKHLGSDFSSIDAMINSLNAVVKELSGKNRDFKTSFNAASMKSLKSIPALMAAKVETSKELKFKQSKAANLAVQLQDARLRQAEAVERAEREKNAQLVKFAVSGLCALASAAVITATGGIAAPVIIGTVTGIIGGAIDSAADEYTEKGWDVDQWDKESIAFDACIGGIKGFIAGSVGSDAGYLEKVLFTSASEVTKSGLTEVKAQIFEYGEINDLDSIQDKCGLAVIESVTEETFGVVFDVFDSSTDGWNSAGKIVKGTLSKVESGAVTRASSAFVKEFEETGNMDKALKSAYESASDLDKIKKDAVKGASKAIGKEIGKSYTDWENTSNSLRELDVLRDMEKKGEFTDWENTSNSPDEIDLLLNLDEDGMVQHQY